MSAEGLKYVLLFSNKKRVCVCVCEFAQRDRWTDAQHLAGFQELTRQHVLVADLRSGRYLQISRYLR